MPPAIGAIIATVASVVITAVKVSLLIKVLLTIAVSLAVTLLAKKPKANKLNQGQELRTKYDPTMTRQVLVGNVATGGSCHFSYTTTNDAKKPNRYLYRVIQLSDRPIHALLRVMEGTQELTWSGDLTTGWRSCLQHTSKSGAPCFWMRVYKGSDAPAADSTLVSETGGIWTNAHKGTGLAYAILKMDSDADAFSGGEPELQWVVEGAHLYDDRKDSTKTGGSGPHRLNNYSTWEYSENTALVTAQTLRGFYTLGQLIVGVQAEERDLSTSMLFSAYNTCDQLVTESTGSEYRYRTGMIMSSDEAIADILVDLQAAMDGKIFDRGGAITLLPGANHIPVMNLSDEDIDWSAEKSWQPKASLEQMLNHITSNFIDSDQNFQERNLPVQRNDAWELDDGGERFSQFFSFRAVNRWGQGQRIVQRMHKASRYNGTIAFIGGIHLLEMEQGDWFTYTSARWNFSGKYFEIQEIDITTEGQVAIIGREVSPLIDEWDWAVDEKPRDDSIWIPPSYELPTPTIYASAHYEQDPVSLSETFSIEVGLTSDPTLYGSIVKYIEYEYSWDSLATTASVGIFPVAQARHTIRGLTPGTSYFVRARLRDSDRGGPWTAWILATTDLAAIIAAGYGPWLTRPAYTVAANPDGSLPGGSLTSAGGTFVVSKHGTILTTGMVFSVLSESAGLNVDINPTTGVYIVISFTADTGVAVFRCVVDGLTIDLAYSISKAKAGAPAITAYLTNENHSLPANNLGVVSTYSGAGGTFVLKEGLADIGASFTLSTLANPQALTVVYTGRDYAVTGGFDAGEPLATLTIRATGSGAYAGFVFDKVFSLGKDLIGPSGTSGSNAISLSLSKDNFNSYAYTNGHVTSYTNLFGQAFVYDGFVDVTASATFSLSASVGITATINTAANTPVSGQPRGYYRITALTDAMTVGTLTITATYAGNVRTAIVQVSKNLVGYEIVSILPVVDNFEGRVVALNGVLWVYTGGNWSDVVDANRIPAGDISSDKLALGVGSNLLSGAIPGTNPNKYVTVGFNPDGIVYHTDIYGTMQSCAGSSWVGQSLVVGGAYDTSDHGTFYVFQNNNSTGSFGQTNFYFRRPIDLNGGVSLLWPVEAGHSYEFTCYTGAHRCQVGVRIIWSNSAGSVIADTVADADSLNNEEKVGGPALVNFKRIRARGKAPAGATYAYVSLEKYHTKAGQADSYMFANHPMFAETTEFATEMLPWNSPAQGLFSAELILFNSMEGNRLKVQSIEVSKIIMNDFNNLIPNGDFASGTLAGYSRITTSGTDTIFCEYQTGVGWPSDYDMTIRRAPGSSSELSITSGTISYSDANNQSAGIPMEVGDEIYIEGLIYCDAGTALKIEGVCKPDPTTEHRLLANATSNATVGGGVTEQLLPTATTSIITFKGYFKNTTGVRTRAWFKFSHIGSAGDIHLWNLKARRKNAAELYVDGSILTNSLGAAVVTAGKVAATNVITLTAQISNLTVDTINIKNNAVTVPAAVFAAGPATIGASSSMTNVAVIGTSTSGSPVLVTVALLHRAVTTSNTSFLVQITRDGGIIYITPVTLISLGSTIGGNQGQTYNFSFLDTGAGAGGHSYAVDIQNTGSTTAMYVHDVSLVTMEVKK